MEEEQKGEYQKSFALFSEQLKDPRSASVLNQIDKITSAEVIRGLTREQQSNFILKTSIELNMTFRQIWGIKKEAEIEAAEDAIERVISRQIYKEVFCSRIEEREEELKFYRHIMTLNKFMTPAHLKVNEKLLSTFTLAYLSEQMKKIHQYKTPKDKMIIFVNFITVIERSIAASNDAGVCFGEIDDFLALVIYYLIKVQPLMLKANLRFVKLFRNQERLVTREGFYHSLMLSAVDYIEKLKAATVGMKAEEFQATYAHYEKLSTASLGELSLMWNYEPVNNTPRIKKSTKRKEIKSVLKKIKKLVEQPFLQRDFENMSFEELRTLVSVQAKALECMQGLSL